MYIFLNKKSLQLSFSIFIIMPGVFLIIYLYSKYTYYSLRLPACPSMFSIFFFWFAHCVIKYVRNMKKNHLHPWLFFCLCDCISILTITQERKVLESFYLVRSLFKIELTQILFLFVVFKNVEKNNFPSWFLSVCLSGFRCPR